MSGLLRLHIQDSSGSREQQFEGGPVVAGRESPGGISLNDPLVSRTHGRFEPRPDGWYFVDAASRNGSFYNGQRLAPEQGIPLRPGDSVRLGNATVTVVDARIAAAPPPPFVAPGVPTLGGPNGATFGAQTAPQPPVVPIPSAPPPVRPPDPSRPSHVGAQDHIVHVGRAIDNDIVINDGYVSSYHFEAWPQDGGLMVKDLGSRNGTFVNGQRITQLVVAPNAVIQMGPNATVTAQQIMGSLAAGPEQSLYTRRPGELEHLVVGQQLGRIVGKEQKTILREVDVAVRRGQFIAIVGGSGAGKSTLMKVLNGYTPPEVGTLIRARDAQGHEEEIGYVPQEDIIHRELPLKDALVLSAMLRYPPNTPQQVVEQRATEVLSELGLSEHTNTMVSRLSGGQRKRASVALELMRRPRLLILDEPTSGLDPASGRRVIKLLRSLANTGVGILLVTHAMENVPDCDTIAFLAPGGHLVYWGTLDGAMKHFGTQDLAEVYDFLDPDGATSDGKRAAVQHWRQRFLESEHYATLRSDVDAGMRTLAPLAQFAPAPQAQDNELVKWQLSGLTRRYARIVIGDRRNLYLLLGQVPIIIVLARIIFSRNVLQPETQAEFISNASKGLQFLFILGASLVWFGTINAAREICKELPIWERESHCGVKPMPYVLSKVAVLGALAAIQTSMLVLLFFVLWKVPGGAGAFIGIIFAGFLAAFAGTALGLAISASVPSADRAMAIVPLVMIPQLMFAGVLIPLKEMGGGKFISYVVSSRFSFEALARFTDRKNYIPNPQNFKLYEQVDGSAIGPVIVLAVHAIAFTAIATWLVARSAPKPQAPQGQAGPTPGQYIHPGQMGVPR